MMYTQKNRRMAIKTPLGDDVLLLRGFAGTEAISQLFKFDLDLLSEDDSVKFQDVVGKAVTVQVFDRNGEERCWHGFISRFSQGSQDRRLCSYRAEMVPRLWFLTRTADCRIFQNKTVPDIIQKILSELDFQDFRLSLYGAFGPRDYCVQYRETDFDFISRLMEEEGIYYYFQHEGSKHILILANHPAAHEQCPNQPAARYDFRGSGSTHEDVITEWHQHEEFRPGAWAQTDYNFETPSTNLGVSVKGSNPYEIYDFPGRHLARDEGDRLARVRLQEQAAPCVISKGSSVCRAFTSGFHFALQDHYRPDLNREYLFTAVRHRATLNDFSAGLSDDEELIYQNSFECIPLSTPFRPPRVTHRPFVQGCQTAIVVGPAGEEVYTDQYGRVKVQFHWDREGKRNEKSSCWIRVSHPWAGKGYGSVSIPRVGHEVIVDFLEGDPDRPIIVGRVYNAQQMPPNGLPKQGMVSGIKSNSTPGGGGSNEMSMDDTKGKEKITIHAQYNMDTTVEHDRTNTVKNDETTTIIGNRTETVNKKETIKIVAGRDETVSAGEKITITGGRTESVDGGEKITITGGREECVTGTEKITITGPRTESVTGAETITITGSQDITVTGARTEHVNAGEQVTITGNTTHTVTGDLILHATGGFGQLGEGGVTINGPTITVQASGDCHIIGGSKLTLAGPGGSIVIDGSGVTIQGSMVSIN